MIGTFISSESGLSSGGTISGDLTIAGDLTVEGSGGAVYDEDFVASGTGIALAEEPNIPTQFHEGLAHYVIMKGYENKMSQDPQSLQKSGYFRNYWELCKKMGTEYGNRNFDSTGFSIKPADGFLM